MEVEPDSGACGCSRHTFSAGRTHDFETLIPVILSLLPKWWKKNLGERLRMLWWQQPTYHLARRRGVLEGAGVHSTESIKPSSASRAIGFTPLESTPRQTVKPLTQPKRKLPPLSAQDLHLTKCLALWMSRFPNPGLAVPLPPNEAQGHSHPQFAKGRIMAPFWGYCSTFLDASSLWKGTFSSLGSVVSNPFYVTTPQIQSGEPLPFHPLLGPDPFCLHYFLLPLVPLQQPCKVAA